MTVQPGETTLLQLLLLLLLLSLLLLLTLFNVEINITAIIQKIAN